MKTKSKLLESYYKAETSPDEEILLRDMIMNDEENTPEKDVFRWYRFKGNVPENLEESLFSGIMENERKAAHRRIFLYRLTSVAAVILLVVGLFIGIREDRYKQMENDFFVMEQALYQISDVIQPEEENEMLILWVDENVEIIIN